MALGDATKSSSPARQSQPHQTQQRLDKALRLAQRQSKQHPHRQHPFNRAIRIDKLSTPLTRPLSIPPFPQRIVQPHRQATTSHQRPIIRRPILNPIHRVRLDRGTTARYFAHHRLFGKRGTCFLPKPRTNLTGEPDSFQLPNAFYATTPFRIIDIESKPLPRSRPQTSPQTPPKFQRALPESPRRTHPEAGGGRRGRS